MLQTWICGGYVDSLIDEHHAFLCRLVNDLERVRGHDIDRIKFYATLTFGMHMHSVHRWSGNTLLFFCAEDRRIRYYMKVAEDGGVHWWKDDPTRGPDALSG